MIHSYEIFLNTTTMKKQAFKITFFSTLAMLALIITFATNCTRQEGTSFYVSPNGSDENPGTPDKPFATIEAARDAVREIKEKNDEYKTPVTVYIMEGTYPASTTIEFDERDGGTSDDPITYTSYKNEKVSINGGIALDPKDFKPVTDKAVLDILIEEKAKDKLLQIDLKEKGITDYGTFKQHGFSIAILPAPMELFVNTAPQVVARYPNEGKVPVSEVYRESSRAIDEDFSAVPGIIGYDYDRPHLWNSPDEIWLWGYYMAGFADDNLGIEKIDTVNKKIHLKHAHMFGMVKTDTTKEWGDKIVGYYAYNILEEIDMPGEYYIDTDKGILYYYPVEDFENASVTLSYLEEPLMAIENTSNLLFKNMDIEYGKGIGIYIEAGENVKFSGCNIRNFGTVGAMLGKGVSGADYPIHEFTGILKSRTVGNLKAHHYGNSDFENNAGKNHGFQSCNFYNLGTGGIVLSGGDRKTLEPAGNSVINCEIHDYNRWNKTYCPGVKLFGVGNIIQHNHIFNAPHQAIEIFGNEHLIEYNHINNVVMNVHDMGAVYIGRNPSERGNVVRHNYFANLGVPGYKNCAIHLDDGASDVLVEGNIFYKASRGDFGDILINGGNDNVIRNNIFIKGAHTLWIENPYLAGIPQKVFDDRYLITGSWGKRMLKDIDMKSDVWQEKYGDFAVFTEEGEPVFLHENQFYKNVIVDETFIISKHNLDTAVFTRNDYIFRTDDDPGFVNMEEQNFNLKENSVVFDEIPGFEPIPFDQIGTYEDEYRKNFK